MRLFVGIEINDEARAALSSARASWERSARAKFCDADLYHLTLAFIGNVEPERLGDLKNTLGKVRFRPFSIKTGQADRFEKGILFAGVQEPNEGLSALQSAVAQVLREEGWAMEDRPYHPHITMAWQAEEFGTPPKIEPVTIPVRRFALFESAQVDGRFCYTPIAHWEAKG